MPVIESEVNTLLKYFCQLNHDNTGLFLINFIGENLIW